MAAIQLCLGSSARDTGRGSSVAKYIREGSDNPAVLKITLLNTGADAYLPEIFGDRIIVKRVISKSSASTYHLLDRNGVVSRLLQQFYVFCALFNVYFRLYCISGKVSH